MRAAPPPTPEAVAEIEAVTQHDVIAFLSAWADNTEPREAAAYVHFGMTCSDLLDTALALQLVEATDLLLARCDTLVAALRDLGLAHRDTVRVGRTHGIHAEPTTWGHRVADLAFAMARSRDRLRARARVRGGRQDQRRGRDVLQHQQRRRAGRRRPARARRPRPRPPRS